MSEADPDLNTALLLGEIRGQLRELIHTSNNNATKIDALGGRIGAVELALAKYDVLSGEVAALKGTVGELASARDQQKGAVGAVEWVSRFGPWLLSLALAILAFIGWKQQP